MTEIKKQLEEYVKMIGADKLIFNPTSAEKEAWEGILFTRGIPRIAFIKALAS